MNQMPTSKIMRHTAATARRTVLLALGGAAVVIVAVVLERTNFERAQSTAIVRMFEANRAAADILLADEQLTMAANMAVATGEKRWIERYENSLADIGKAIDRAKRLASPSAAKKFDQETRVSNDRLVQLERAAFDAMNKGDVRGARRLLDSGLYAHYKRTLADGSTSYFQSVRSQIHAQLLRLQRRTEVYLPLVIMLCGFGAYYLWYRLNVSLGRLHRAFVRAESTIRQLAMKDALTGLANRRALFFELKNLLERARAQKRKLAVFMIDLDRFKPVNDQYGHLAGDIVLKEVADRLVAALPDAQILARYGGDEFVVVYKLDSDFNADELIARKIIDVLANTMSVEGNDLRVGATLGSAIYPDDASAEEELIAKADLALRRGKSQGSGAAVAYNAYMDIDVDARSQLETELRNAISSGEFVPYFQPVVDMSTGRVRGFEILCRWNHPTRGLLQPSEFIPFAEASHLIGDLTIALLRAACAGARAFPETITLAINIAPRQIQNPALAHGILAVLSETGFAPHRLEVELTETALVCDIAAAKHVIASLKGLGIKVALDDFGTGYSSLCYLSELPIDMIKIDRAFISTMHTREESAKIVIAILGLSKSLQLATIAEGVEGEVDAEFLKANGCIMAQGRFYGMPMPLEEALVVLANGGIAPGHRKVA